MKTYRTIDLLKAVYDGKIFKNTFKNTKTGKIIRQGEKIDEDYSKQFYDSDGKNFIPRSVDNLNSLSFRNAFIKFIEEEWEEVQEPVSFIEAVKSGKKSKWNVLI